MIQELKQPKHIPPTKQNVIISTRTNKLQKKYQLEKVPYPFTSLEQYERSLQDPVGPEWNTTQQLEKKIKPDVTVKAGSIIQPIQFPNSKKKSKLPTNRKGL